MKAKTEFSKRFSGGLLWEPSKEFDTGDQNDRDRQFDHIVGQQSRPRSRS